MIEGWEEKLLSDVAEVQTGPFGSQLKNEQYITGGTQVVTVEHIEDFRIVDFDFPSVTAEDRDRLSRYSLETGDIVFTRVGSVDLSAFVDENRSGWMFSSRMLRVRPDPSKVHAKFLSYYFRTKNFREHILSISVGATMPSINTAILKGLPLSLPAAEQQEAIAEVLSSLDDKIDLLHRQNATLEALAETLFRQYFIEEAQDDWEDGILDDVVTVKGGTTPSTKNSAFWDGDIHWTSPRDLSGNNGLFLLDTARKITPEGLAQIGSGLLPAGSLLMSSRAPVGYLAFSVNPVAINQGYIGILDDKGFSKEFIFLWLKINMEYVKGHANGSTFQEISKSTFKRLDITKPPEQLRQKFQELAMPMFEKLLTNTLQCQNLQRLHESLLTRLMSGAVRVHVSV